MTVLVLPMIVNALVTGLIVCRILKVYLEVKTRSADDRNLGAVGGSTLQLVMFILIDLVWLCFQSSWLGSWSPL